MAKLASGTRIYGSAIIDSTLDVGNTTVTGTLTVGGTSINSTFFAGQSNTALTANNADYLDGQHGAYYAANSLLANYALLTGATFSGAVTFNANATLGAADHLILSSTSGISANGTYGTTGHVLHSNGTAVYWDADAQGVTSVGSGNGLTGGTITTTGSLSVLANTGLVANATGLFVNSAYIATVTVNSANNADYLDGQHGAYYAANSLLANYALLTGATFSGAVTMNANLTLGAADHLILSSTSGVSANGSYGTSGQVLSSNGTAAYWASPAATGVTSVATGNGLTGGPITTTGTVSVLANTGIVANATGVYVNSAYIATLSSNNATYFNGYTWGAPAAIGGTTANTATFSGLSVSGARPIAFDPAGGGISIKSDAGGWSTGYYFRGSGGGDLGGFGAYGGGTALTNFWIGSAYNNTALEIYAAGYAQGTASLRAPIFYDTNNTGYYIDPTGTSYVNIVQLADTGAIVFNDRGRDANTVTLPNWASRSVRWDFVTQSSTGVGSNYSGLMTFVPWSGTTASTGDASYQLAFGGTASNGSGVPQLRIRKGIDTTWNSFYNIHHDGYTDMYAAGSFRAPIFYDSDNTGYYIDAATGSVLSEIYNYGWYRSYGAVGWYSQTYGGGIYMNGTTFVETYGSKHFLCDQSIRTPIFYDSDNTAYYVDGSSTSNLNNLTVAGTLTATISGYAALSGANFTGGISTTGDLGVGSEINMTGAATKYFDHNGTLNFRYSDNSTFYTQAFQINSGIYTVASGSSRAPIFYDSDDTISRWNGSELIMRGGSPTIYMRDTDHNSAMIHCNSNIFYVLRGGNDTETWTQVGGYWPLEINLTNNNAQFGGTIWAAGNITAYSDARLKENVVTVDSPLDKLLKLRGVYYTLKRDPESVRKIGVIAQEVQQVLPEVVLLNQDNPKSEPTLSVDYGNMAGLFIEAIKEQQEIIQAQNAKINSLEDKLNQILTLLGNN